MPLSFEAADQTAVPPHLLGFVWFCGATFAGPGRGCKQPPSGRRARVRELDGRPVAMLVSRWRMSRAAGHPGGRRSAKRSLPCLSIPNYGKICKPCRGLEIGRQFGATANVGPGPASKKFLHEGINSVYIRWWFNGRPVPRQLPWALGILRNDRKSCPLTCRRPAWQEIRRAWLVDPTTKASSERYVPTIFRPPPRISRIFRGTGAIFPEAGDATPCVTSVASCDRVCGVLKPLRGNGFSPWRRSDRRIWPQNRLISAPKPPISGAK
jgi:hypothetical protein